MGGRFKIDNSGNVSCSGTITNGSNSYMYTGGLRISGNDYDNTIYQDLATIGGQPANIVLHLFNFNSFSTTSGVGYTTIMSMNTSGVSLFTHLIYNYLSNSSGFNHETINDFNSITHYGYRFVQGNTNGPGTPSINNQYYSWAIGLGINYLYSSYACQFALPRNTSNPVMSVRFREGGTWGGWSGITA